MVWCGRRIVVFFSVHLFIEQNYKRSIIVHTSLLTIFWENYVGEIFDK